MDTTDETPAPPPDRGRRWRSGVVAVGAAAGMTLAGLGVAAAQSDTTTTAPPAAPTAPDPGAPAPPGGMGHRHRGGMLMGGIHGEFTTRAPGGGYQTLATQVGEVTSVSASSITVKSEDGYSRTYTVGDDTLVNAGNDGIDDVETGDTVRVTAVVRDGTAAAVDIDDGTRIRELRGKWMPPPRMARPDSGETGTTAS